LDCDVATLLAMTGRESQGHPAMTGWGATWPGKMLELGWLDCDVAALLAMTRRGSQGHRNDEAWETGSPQ
jgi:hypothetical protein